MREQDLRSSFRIATKSAAYVFTAIATLYALFRVAIPYTWGMHSDLAPIVTLAVAVFGAVGFAYMLFAMIKDLIRENRAAETRPLIQDDSHEH